MGLNAEAMNVEEGRSIRAALALISGTLFGLGLSVSQMIDPAKVLAFLDVTGAWDPTLAMVMIGALSVTVPAFPLVLRRSAPLCASRFELPTKKDVDPRVCLGAIIFGIGWGLGGLCPGPALAALVTGSASILVFVLGMLAGMVAYGVAIPASEGSPTPGDTRP